METVYAGQSLHDYHNTVHVPATSLEISCVHINHGMKPLQTASVTFQHFLLHTVTIYLFI